MENLKNLTEQFLKIKGKYDAGNKYKWIYAYHDLENLENKIKQTKSRSDWTRMLIRLLCREVHEELTRVWEIAVKRGEVNRMKI